MYQVKPKSFRIKRIECKIKKFQIRACQLWAKAKTFTGKSVEKLSQQVAQRRTHTKDKAVHIEIEPASPKVKPKPLSGVRLKYELLPIGKAR